MVTLVGSPERIAFEFDWERPAGSLSASDATRAALRVTVDHVPVWYGEDLNAGFEWTWIELLEFLARSWSYIILEDGPPAGITVRTPTAFEAEVETLLQRASSHLREPLGYQIDSFLEWHDLARAVAGAVLPALYVVRAGTSVHFTSDAASATVPASSALELLTALGDSIAQRVEGNSDPRSVRSLERWAARADVTATDRVEIATGLDREQLELIEGAGEDLEVWETDGPELELNEMMVAARLSAGLHPLVIRSIMDHVRATPRITSDALDKVSLDALRVLTGLDSTYAYEQGYALALWLRRRLNVPTDNRSDPEQILGDLGVPVTDIEVTARDIDAVACWGPKHGPAVLVNVRGKHSEGIAGRRSTIAHEIAHLIIDRFNVLPFVEVLGGNVDRFVEARARAFAAELLLPREVAGEALRSETEGVRRVVEKLQSSYDVSPEIIAWQARNSSVPLGEDVLTVLRNFVSRPRLF